MKQERNPHFSNRLELLAKEMRERALLLEVNPEFTDKDLQGAKLKKAKERQMQKVEGLKKLYFNAGRWAGGARDHIAREAFELFNARESR
jgi:hypothetical protein